MYTPSRTKSQRKENKARGKGYETTVRTMNSSRFFWVIQLLKTTFHLPIFKDFRGKKVLKES